MIFVRKRPCPVCWPSVAGSWVVSDESGTVLHCSPWWSTALAAAVDIADATWQPGTGDQVQKSE